MKKGEINMNKNYKNKSRFNSKSKQYPKTIRGESKNTIFELKAGDFFCGKAKILRKTQPGPVIFTLSDGYGTIDGVIKSSDFKVDDTVEVKGAVSERAGSLQVDIKSISKSNFDFDRLMDEKSNPVRTEFSIKSERYEKMKLKFIEIAKIIRKAVLGNHPIVIRHHNDSDGINAGLAIEHACTLLMERIGINPNYNLYRNPSKAPFYETGDVFRDLVLSKRLTDEHKQKKPLIILLDNGSTPEDLFSFKIMKSTNHDCIVIDHHNPVVIKNGKTEVCPYLTSHLNPYLYGLDSQTSAGMLCYEVARFISEDFENPAMPAVSAISDRCNIEETERYVKNSGKTIEELKEIGVAIDYIAYNLRFDSGEGVFEELYSNPKLVKLINVEVRKSIEKQLQSTMPYLRTQEINGIIFSHIDLEKYTLRFSYPTPGKVIGMIHDEIANGKDSPVLTIGHLSDMIIIRATKPVLPVQKIIEKLHKEMPSANADGGGHEMAGTIKFVPAHLEKILEAIKEEIKKIDLKQTSE